MGGECSTHGEDDTRTDKFTSKTLKGLISKIRHKFMN
jgi:hypothetical protein